jgi:response regulator RpfG family c-di-GMP phosphodiesterase
MSDNMQLAAMQQEISEMKSVLKELTTAVSKLAVIEERQSTVREATQRLEDTNAGLIVRITALELANVTNKQTNDWAGKAIWGAVSGLGVYLMKKAGIL